MKGNMNYYPFHIGDYATHTAHLEPLEDLAYRRLLDLYYLREGRLPIDTDECARLIRLREAPSLVASVLAEFFERTDSGWSHARCNEELFRFHDKQSKAQASAQASVAARRARAEQTSSDRSTTVELPEPKPKPKPEPEPSSSTKKKAQALQTPIGVSEEVWQSFLLIRKAKKAPVTDLALLGIRREAVKAGIELEQALTICCERGWAGFKAEWMQGQQGKPQAESFYERDQRLKREEARKWGGGSSTTDPFTIEAEVSHVTAIESD